MRRSCTLKAIQEIAFMKILKRTELNELCKGSSIIRVVLHYLSKLKLIYLTSDGYVILVPWLMYLKELHGNRWVDVLDEFLRREGIVIEERELNDIKKLVEDHPIKSLYDFVKVYLRFRDYVDELSKIPSKSIPNYCEHYGLLEDKDPQDIYLSCIAPLLSLSSWTLELMAELIREIAMHPDSTHVLMSFFESWRETTPLDSSDFYREVPRKFSELIQFTVSVKAREDPIEKVISEYNEKMKISYDERSYVRNMLKSIILSRLRGVV